MNESSRSFPPKLSLIITVVSAIVGSIVGTAVVSRLPGMGGSADVDATLVKTSDAMNRMLPRMVDNVTRLETTVALPGKTLLYKYTVLIEPGTPFDAEEFKQVMRPKLVNGYQSTEAMSGIRKSGVTLVYSYYNEAGVELARIDIKSTDTE